MSDYPDFDADELERLNAAELRDHGYAARPSTNGQHHRKPAAHSEASAALPLLYYRDIHPALDAADFVEGLLIDGAMSVIYGESGCGKTFFTLDLALHVAAGLPWRDREVERGGVLYLALEGCRGIRNRIAAFKAAKQISDADLPFAVVPVSVNLCSSTADVERVIGAAKAAAAEMAVPVKLIVIDTLSRALAGGNENDSKDMGSLVRNVDMIRQSIRAHSTLVHHTGKDGAKGARGHSLLRAATDTEIEVARDPGGRVSVARVTKQRELDSGDEFPFRLQSVHLGTNRRGNPVCSCIVEPIDAENVAALAEAIATERAIETAERKAGEKAERTRLQDAAKEAAAAAKLAANVKRVLAAIDAVCTSEPAATKRQLRLKTNLRPDPLDLALISMADTGTIECLEFAKATGNGTPKLVEGYRRTTPVTPVQTPVALSDIGVDTGVQPDVGNAGGANAGGAVSPLRETASVRTIVTVPNSALDTNRSASMSNTTPEQKPEPTPKAQEEKKPPQRKRAKSGPKLFEPLQELPD